jgi:DNA polymerase III epsilon subunit-like protein
MDAALPPLPEGPADAPLRYVDTETAGGRAGPQSLIEVAVIDEEGAVLLDTLVDPGRPIDPFTMRIHGISDAMVQGAPTWDRVAPRLAALLEGAELVAHHAAFDAAVLGPAAAAARRVTCTLALCRRKLGRPHRLAAVAALAGHVPAGAWHRARADALACRSAHRWLVARPDLTPEERRAQREAWRAARALARPDRRFGDPRLVRVPRGLCPEPVLAGEPWTPFADALLARLWREGRDVPAILEAIPRTPVAIFARLERLALIPREANPYGPPSP